MKSTGFGILLAGSMALSLPAAAVDVQAEYDSAKEKLSVADRRSREIMGTLYEINQRMKNVSKRRDALNNRMLDAEGNVKTLARQTAVLGDKIKTQKNRLSRRLRAMYMIGEESVVRILFSTASSPDLDQTLKYLKIISDRDFSLIKSYQRNLNLLNRKKESLNAEVKKLLRFKDRVKNQERILSQDQNSKAALLTKLKSQKESAFQKILKLQLNLSFFENKGKLPAPVAGDLQRDYGLVINDDYQYRLSHKGHAYSVAGATEVKSVFDGQAAFVGRVDGYGWTVVVDHGDHYYTVYSGFDTPLVKENEPVKQNQAIANTAGGLYFEIRHFSDAINPKGWLKNI